jgi:hypothetical protein
MDVAASPYYHYDHQHADYQAKASPMTKTPEKENPTRYIRPCPVNSFDEKHQ